MTQERVRQIAQGYSTSTGGVITALRAIQEEFRCVPASADHVVADVFNLSRAEVRGVISFYADFTREPTAKTVIRLCVAEACQAAGARQLRASLAELIDDDAAAPGHTKIEPIFCLGLCSAAPAAMIGDILIGRADTSRISAAVSTVSKGG